MTSMIKTLIRLIGGNKKKQQEEENNGRDSVTEPVKPVEEQPTPESAEQSETVLNSTTASAATIMPQLQQQRPAMVFAIPQPQVQALALAWPDNTIPGRPSPLARRFAREEAARAAGRQLEPVSEEEK